MSESKFPIPPARVGGSPRNAMKRQFAPLLHVMHSAGGGNEQAPGDPVQAYTSSSKPFFRGSDKSNFPGPLEAGFRYTGGNRAEFYRYLRDRLPIVSAGVWAWVHLCATSLERRFDGPTYARKQAEQLLDAMEARMQPYPGYRAFDRLTEALFLELFTLGRCAAEILPLPDLSGIAGVSFLDPYRVHFGSHNKQYFQIDENHLIPVIPERFFYAVLQHDPSQPGGIEPLATLPFVLAIESQLVEDMALTSHNVGAPRLQVKVTPPQREPSESAEEYESRVGRYFDDTVSGFAKLDPDDNLFTWNDVEVTVIGGDGMQKSNWRINRQEVIEDVVTGLKLFPWVLGRSHGTTKNWVQAQFNMLMHIVGTLQLRGLQLAERLANTELALRGNPTRVRFSFTPHTDPFALQHEQAFSLKVDTLLKLVANGYLTKEQAHLQLGNRQ
ncbi:MAG: hypothetical protein OEM52_07970 [bacterium]|nr:hypothetical protein [bacterium]